jgi:hypothetical protein
MTLARYSSLAVMLMGAMTISAAQAQGGGTMRQNHDGIYAVDITTRHGRCNRDYHWLIAVSGGRVSSAGDTANGSLRPDQPARYRGLGVPAFRAGRHGYRKARDEGRLGDLVINDDAMRRFLAGHKARLRPAKINERLWRERWSFRAVGWPR